MNAHDHAPPPPLDLSGWRNVPNWLIGAGGLLALAGLVASPTQFGYSWLLAFMFGLSLALGALFLVIVHHLFDAGWSVPIRRFCEHLAALAVPALAVLFVPVAVLARWIYPWMTADPRLDHALQAKQPLFTMPMFCLMSALCFAAWGLVASKLRFWSLQQDKTGAPACTHAMRRWAAGGVFLYAAGLTLAAMLWVKALEHQWYSTIYGVCFFAGSVWVTLATVYVITVLLQKTGSLRGLLHEHQYYFLGSLLLAFTVFHAYIHFSQYFVIWNANLPEETFWYKLRERGSWWNVGLLLVFGHFFLPFLVLLRIDAKRHFGLMTGLGVWAWLMHYCDLAFNILPVAHPEGFPWRWLWLDLACLALVLGILTKVFLRNFLAHAPYPRKDPRLGEALGHDRPAASPVSGGEPGPTDAIEERPEHPTEAQPESTGGIA